MRRSQAGLTMLEVMIASATMVIMMSLAWRTISNTSARKRTFTRYQERNHELRMALGRTVADLESAYLSRNEDQGASHPRTMFIAKPGSRVPEMRFSTLAHRVPAFETLKVVNAWCCHYDLSTLDHNAILGAHPDVAGFLLACGFSGHGLQHSPGIGRAMAELITHGTYRTIDLTRFGWGRIAANAPLAEANVF